jgi:hypothetical protein
MTTTPDTSTRIDEIRAREQAATPGHWGTYYDGKGTYTVQAQPRLIPGTGNVTAGDVATLSGEHGDGQTYADARFIGHAREDVPYLLDRVAELEAQVTRVRAWATSHGYRWLHELLDGYGTHGGHL